MNERQTFSERRTTAGPSSTAAPDSLYTSENNYGKTAEKKVQLNLPISEYQPKLIVPKVAKRKHSQGVRSVIKTHGGVDQKLDFQLSNRQLQDTYMVGGCVSDLKNAYKLLMPSTTSNRHSDRGNRKHSMTLQRHRPSNMSRTRALASGPMQLEPNPLFSMIDEQMEAMNKVTLQKLNRKKPEVSNVIQFHQSSKSVNRIQDGKGPSSASSEPFGDYEVIAYSNHKKQGNIQKVSKKASDTTLAKEANGPSTDVNIMWQKYRQNLQEHIDKAAVDTTITKAPQQHSRAGENRSLGRDVQRYNPQISSKQTNVEVDNDKAHTPDPTFNSQTQKFQRPAARDGFTQSRQSNKTQLESRERNSLMQFTKNGSTPITQQSRDVVDEEELLLTSDIPIAPPQLKADSSELSKMRRLLQTEQQQPKKNKNLSSQKTLQTQNTPNSGSGRKIIQLQGKNTAVNDKVAPRIQLARVSTSIKSQWTVNRSVLGQPYRHQTSNPQSAKKNEQSYALTANPSRKESDLSEQDRSKSQFTRERGIAQIEEQRNLKPPRQQIRNNDQVQVQNAQQQKQFQQLALSPCGSNSRAISSKKRFDPIAQSPHKKFAGLVYQQQPQNSSKLGKQYPKNAAFLSSSSKARQALPSSRNSTPQESRNPAAMSKHMASEQTEKKNADIASFLLKQPSIYNSISNKKQKNRNFEQLMTAGSTYSGGAKRLTPIKQPERAKNQSKLNEEEQKVVPQGPKIQLRYKEFIYSDPGVKIGSGKFGPVNLIIHKGKLFALKIIPKSSIDQSKRIEHVRNEKVILQTLRKNHRAEPRQASRQGSRASRHSNNNSNHSDRDQASKDASKEPLDFIMELHETFMDENNVNFVFEYLPGQDLFWILQNEHNLNLGKQQSRKDWVLFYSSEIICALETLHSRHIIYRDLKPDNVMIDYEGHIKLIDFGFSKILDERASFRTRTNCGTIGYTAPEVLLGVTQGYSFPVDIWSFGIMLAELLSGSLPFQEKEDPLKVQEAIVKGQLKLNKEGIDFIAKDLLNKIFQGDPELRPTIAGVKKHRLLIEGKPADYWNKIQTKQIQEVPYKPNPLKYAYLLQNEYPTVSNLTRTEEPKVGRKRGTTPNAAQRPPIPRAGSSTKKEDTYLDQTATSDTFGRAAETASAYVPLNEYKTMTLNEKRPSNLDRELNFGMFGRGGGDFDVSGNMKNGPICFDVNAMGPMASTVNKKKPNYLLGDFTLYRVNKEFEHF